MLRYELLLLTVPEITEDEARSLETQLDKLIKEAGGTTISFERWGKYRLAYPVRKNDYGIYFLMRFEVDSPQPILDNIRSIMAVKLNGLVMRHMVTALSPKQSLAYQRPPSLEETPSRDVDSFLKEHKMEGLLSSMKGSEKGKAAAPKLKESIEVEEEINHEKEGNNEDTESKDNS